MPDDWFEDLYSTLWRSPTSEPPASTTPPRWTPVTDDFSIGEESEPREEGNSVKRPEVSVPDLAVLAVGSPIHVFEPRPSAAVPYRPDTVIDGWSTRDVAVRAASTRGYGHRWNGLPRQDDVAIGVHEPTGVVIVVVSDGVSACSRSHLGATAVCRHTLQAAKNQLDLNGRLDWKRLVAEAAWTLVHLAKTDVGSPEPTTETEAPFEPPGGPERDPVSVAASDFACTIVAAAVWPTPQGLTVEYVSVGDSSLWILDQGTWHHLAGKASAESAFVSHQTAALPKVPSDLTSQQFDLPQHAVLVIGTDGFGDALGSGHDVVGQVFTNILAEPVPPLRLAYALDFSLDTFDDDRTLVAVWPRRERENP